MPAMSAAFWPVSCPITYLLSRSWAALPAEALPWGVPPRAAERFAADLYNEGHKSPVMQVLTCEVKN